MALPVEVRLAAYRGDTWSQQFRLLTSDGNPVDLTGSTVAAWAARAGAVEHLVVTKQAAPGVLTISMPTSGPLGAGEPWAYDIEVTTGGAVTTWIRGTITVTPDVTNAP